MSQALSGATRVHFIVGDPIAQVKSPAGVTQAFHDAGRNAVCIPAHVAPNDLAGWTKGVSLAQNVDGIIVTVPHKFSCFELCATTSDRAGFLKAVNTLRRNADGTWHGDMFDGMGYVEALKSKGCEPRGQRALLVGAGGAGSAIAYSLMTAGVKELAVHDADVVRRDALVARLASLGLGKVSAGSSDPTGFDLCINATPIGMKEGDPHPIDSTKFTAQQFVGCVITAPAVPPMIAAARAKGCNTLTGADMFARVRDLMVQFLLEA
ncbi:shikimate dehydrogenase [Limnohabitans sp.]|jgi:shikimate dehydrogenase|uniref:shikimate dehydrogenase family protein n=1 Tax=Limnohabitans sp. TaxID=1907725 RepID=UPI0035B0876E